MKNLICLLKRIIKPYIILPIITLFCLAGFIGSYVFPNTVLDTYVINMKEEEGDSEIQLPLSCDSPIVYEMDTNGLSMRGIQVGINKRGSKQEGTILLYNVYIEDQLISQNSYDISQGDDLQFVYLPYDNYEMCKGKIHIEFLLNQVNNEVSPALMANHKEIKDTMTLYTEQIVSVQSEIDHLVSDQVESSQSETDKVSLKCSYIYTHKTYPFLYDFRILTFLFLAVSMTVCYPKRKEKGGDYHAKKVR